MDKTNDSYRHNFIATSSDQYSYDYDGAAIPIKILPRRIISKVNVLSTTYRVAKENILNKKGSISKILPTINQTDLYNESGREDIKSLTIARKQ